MTDQLRCEYSNVEHQCSWGAQWRIWADVTMEWHYACPAAVDALTAFGASRASRRINLVMEAVA